MINIYIYMYYSYIHYSKYSDRLWCLHDTTCVVCVTNDHGYVSLFVFTIRYFPHSWLVTWFVIRVTWRVPQLLKLAEHLSSPPGFIGVHVPRFLIFCVMYCRSLFVSFLLAIVLSVILRFKASDYPFGIFKVLLHVNVISCIHV